MVEHECLCFRLLAHNDDVEASSSNAAPSDANGADAANAESNETEAKSLKCNEYGKRLI